MMRIFAIQLIILLAVLPGNCQENKDEDVCELYTDSNEEFVRALLSNKEFTCYLLLDTGLYHFEDNTDPMLLEYEGVDSTFFGMKGYFLNIHSLVPIEGMMSKNKMAFNFKVSSSLPSDYNYQLTLRGNTASATTLLSTGKILEVKCLSKDL